MKFWEKMKSRRFIIVVLGAAIAAGGKFIGLPSEMVAGILKLFGVYVAGKTLDNMVRTAKGNQ